MKGQQLRALLSPILCTSLGLALSASALAQVSQPSTDSMVDPADNPAQDMLDIEGYEDDDFLDEEPGGGPVTTPPHAILLEPAGLSVLPILSYGLGYSHDLADWLGPNAQGLTLRARYARGSATLGNLHAVTELSTLEVTWSFARWLYLAAGPAYRNVRVDLKDAIGDEGGAGAAATATGLFAAFGVMKPVGTYVLGCDVIGAMVPLGGVRHTGGSPDDLLERDPHAERLEDAGDGYSLSVLRLYFGPRF